jgi:sarcosine/dimethylglycine N-methyltransferase
MNETATEQDYGDNPVEVRETDHYTSEYVGSFVERWDQLIDWDARAESEGYFFIDVLQERGVRKVLDVATGTGFHSIRLLEAGFEVVSADGSPEMLAKAFENGRSRGHILRTVNADWRWLNRDVHEKFDAIICLGNSFTHLFSERDRRKALAEFYAALRHDGILIMDQRNYDMIMDDGFHSKHTYYYCGHDVKAAPEHTDEGLCRFRYEFPDNSVFHLNMFPLRKAYLRKLMHEVGFQRVQSFGDFQETHHQEQPDFFIHIAEKSYDSRGEEDNDTETGPNYSNVVQTARTYYNSNDADNFYAHIWGGEDIHIGLYKDDEESIFDASHRTVETMISMLNLQSHDNVLDIGAGYGGSARAITKSSGCQVDCLNLSEVQNKRNRELNHEQGLARRIHVIDGSFEDIPAPANQYNVVWSQDSILHSGNRRLVLEEVSRVIRTGGHFIFTDPMQADDCPEGVLQPVLDRIHLDSLGSVKFYREVAEELGFEFIEFVDYSENLTLHYGRVLREIETHYDDILTLCSRDYVDRMKVGLKHWVEAGQKGYLKWGVLHFRKMR